MSRFREMMKKNNVRDALTKHALADADAQVKKDYMQGLVFVALEDDNFSQEERDYLTLLMQHLDMDVSLMEGFETFAKDDSPDDEMNALMERMDAFDEGLKIHFLVEVILLAFKDGSFDEQEQTIFDDLIDMLDMKEKATLIQQLAESIGNGNMDLALSLYTAHKDLVLPLQHLFELSEMYLDDELKALYRWDWVKWDFVTGEVEDDNLVATKPVTVRQIVVFLNALVSAGRVEQLPNSQRFEHKDDEGNLLPLIVDLSISNLHYEDGLFTYQADDAKADFVGGSKKLPDFFTYWLNPLIEGSVQLLYVKVNYTMRLRATAQSYLTESPEMLRMHLSYKSIGNRYKVIMDHGNGYDYEKEGGLKTDVAYTFRLMKLQEEEASS